MENQGSTTQQNNIANDEVQVESSIQQSSSDTGSAVVPGRDNDKKIFVGGLTRETTEDDLRDYFTKFGGIASINIKVDPDTGNSKGYGFIVFNTVESITQVIGVSEHVIKNKKIDAQVAKIRNGKVFVGGITNDITDGDVKSYFAQFGSIIGVEVPFDKTKNQRKNFCFVLFESEEAAKKALKNPKQTINGKQVDVKRAATKPNHGDSQRYFSQRNAGTIEQNWDQSYNNQAYGGYGLNNQQGFGSVYGGYGAGCSAYGAYGSVAYENYGYGDPNGLNRNYGAVTGRGAHRGGLRGGRGMNRGGGGGRGTRGGVNRFQPF